MDSEACLRFLPNDLRLALCEHCDRHAKTLQWQVFLGHPDSEILSNLQCHSKAYWLHGLLSASLDLRHQAVFASNDGLQTPQKIHECLRLLGSLWWWIHVHLAIWQLCHGCDLPNFSLYGCDHSQSKLWHYDHKDA